VIAIFVAAFLVVIGQLALALWFLYQRTYVHLKSGHTYIKLFETNKGSEKPAFVRTTVYLRPRTMRLFSRMSSEFNEKFRKV
jgi:hypothetical protein